MRHRRTNKELADYLDSLIGTTFTFLTVESVARTSREARVFCRCKCGKTRIARLRDITTGRIKSCGCFRFTKPETKACYRCKKVLPYTSEFFGNDANAYFKLKPACKKCTTQETRIYVDRLRLEILTHYSNGSLSCACCGITEFIFLCLDHINNNGYEEKKAGYSGPSLLMKIKRENFPPGYQVLCYNCNMAKALAPGRICPHKTKYR
jgi:hypothetical protein